MLAESDARYGGFDFRAAHAESPSDLQQLLDNTESLPFRRRGYERDGMLRTMIKHAGMAELVKSAQSASSSKAETLAAVPVELAHFQLDSLFVRPVQDTVVELLLLSKSNERFTSCVLVHGMGGTGKVGSVASSFSEPTNS